MAALKDVVAYIVDKYPYDFDLSKARVTKMVYLADWQSALDRRSLMTDIDWKFNHYGPYVQDVVDVAREYPEFDVVRSVNPYGNLVDLIKLRVGGSFGSLTKDDKRILDKVMNDTKGMNWSDFMRYVYSTYPVLSRSYGDRLNLVNIASEYRDLLPTLGEDDFDDMPF